MDAPSSHAFLVEHRRLVESPNHFIPTARLIIQPALRESGLLSLLSDRQARLLLALLTFLSPNGQVQATASEVARALGMSTPVAALWLLHFATRRFHGTHLIYQVRREEGRPYFALSRGAVAHEHDLPRHALPPTVYLPAGREPVLHHSRTTYGMPRAEVERTVMEQLGHAPEEMPNTPEGAVWRRLRALKFGPNDIRSLIQLYGSDRILRQLDWLPERRAKNPVRYLVAALKGDYSAPLSMQHDTDAVAAASTQRKGDDA